MSYRRQEPPPTAAVHEMSKKHMSVEYNTVYRLPEKRPDCRRGGAPNISSVAQRQLADGVIYYRVNYTNSDCRNVDAYVVAVASGAAAEAAVRAAPQGETKTVAQQADELEETGENVLAMSNAGYFHLASGELTSYGIQIIGGRVINEPSKAYEQYSDNWFGMTDDGRYVISDTDGYFNTYKGRLRYAVGGGFVLMRNRRITAPVMSTPDPRTAIALTADGGFALLCADGRSDASAGADYNDIVRIFTELDIGTTDILNLDGGGSTTLMVEDTNGRPVMVNTPSDKPDRRVADTLAVISCPAGRGAGDENLRQCTPRRE